MSNTTTPVKDLSARASVLAQEPNDEAVRDYAYHLYQQGGCASGHDLDNWLEATACLKANIPAQASRSRLHDHVHGLEREGLFFSSPAVANRELITLRREREDLESGPRAIDSDVRASLFDDRP